MKRWFNWWPQYCQNSILPHKQIYSNKCILLLNYCWREYETVVKHLQFQRKYQSLLKIELFPKYISFIAWWSVKICSTKHYIWFTTYLLIDLKIWFLIICFLRFHLLVAIISLFLIMLILSWYGLYFWIQSGARFQNSLLM